VQLFFIIKATTTSNTTSSCISMIEKIQKNAWKAKKISANACFFKKFITFASPLTTKRKFKHECSIRYIFLLLLLLL